MCCYSLLPVVAFCCMFFIIKIIHIKFSSKYSFLYDNFLEIQDIDFINYSNVKKRKNGISRYALTSYTVWLKEMDLNHKFAQMTSQFHSLKHDVKNINIKQQLIENIADILEYAVNNNNKHISEHVLDFTNTLFINVGSLDYDEVECVLNALTASRMVLCNKINNI